MIDNENIKGIKNGKIRLGGKEYTLSKPTFGTLVEISREMHKIPVQTVESGTVGFASLLEQSEQADCIFRVFALAILGKRRFFSQSILPWKNRGQMLAERLQRSGITVAEISVNINPLFEYLEIQDFAYLSVMLGKLNFTHPTKKDEPKKKED